MNLNENNIDPGIKKPVRNYSWLSLLFGFSLIPILLLAGPLLSLFPEDRDLSIYMGLSIGLLAVSLQIAGFIIGITGLIREPKRLISGLGSFICFVFCSMVLFNLFK